MRLPHRFGVSRCRAARFALAACALFALGHTSSATSLLPRTDEQEIASADAALRGTVLATRSFRDPATGRVWTDVWLRTDETFKGRLPRIVRLRQPGGSIAGGGESNALSPHFVTGEERLVFLGRRGDGTAFARRGEAGTALLRHADGRIPHEATTRLHGIRRTRGARARPGADLLASPVDGSTSLPATTADGAIVAETVTTGGLLLDANGIPSRNPDPDRGAAIPYLVDVDARPSGITRAQALTCVDRALAAWSAVTSAKFVFEGTISFGKGADNVAADDGRLRIQLHDRYGSITGGDGILGIGGMAWQTVADFATVGGEGGRVGNREFHRAVRGYVVVSHTEPSMSTLSTFEEVLCHEIGHALGLAHSSENQNEPDTVKRDAVMFAYVHADGRGARLGTYDPPVVRTAYPADNTPPWTCDRVMRVLTAPTAPTFAGANTLPLVAFDRQTAAANLTWSHTTASSGTGSFTMTGASLTFTPNAYYGDFTMDPATNSSYAFLHVRASDGVNASPWVSIRVVAFAPDTYPTGGDGLPDAWMLAQFGNANPAAGPGRGPADDPDGDGLTNLDEYRLGTDPLDPASRLAVTSFGLDRLEWNARPYEFYYLERSTDLRSWTAMPATAAQPTTTTGSATNFVTPSQPREFYRVRHAP